MERMDNEVFKICLERDETSGKTNIEYIRSDNSNFVAYALYCVLLRDAELDFELKQIEKEGKNFNSYEEFLAYKEGVKNVSQ